MTPGEGAAKFQHIFPPFGVGDPFIFMIMYSNVMLTSRDYLFVRRSATTSMNEGGPVLSRTRGVGNKPNNATVFSNRASKSRARKRGWGQLGAGNPYSPC